MNEASKFKEMKFVLHTVFDNMVAPYSMAKMIVFSERVCINVFPFVFQFQLESFFTLPPHERKFVPRGKKHLQALLDVCLEQWFKIVVRQSITYRTCCLSLLAHAIYRDFFFRRKKKTKITSEIFSSPELKAHW